MGKRRGYINESGLFVMEPAPRTTWKKRALLAEAARTELREVLLRVQWVSEDDEPHCCPICGMHEEHGHSVGCGLRLALNAG